MVGGVEGVEPPVQPQHLLQHRAAAAGRSDIREREREREREKEIRYPSQMYGPPRRRAAGAAAAPAPGANNSSSKNE